MNLPEHRVLLVCDASSAIGSGHVMRQITLGIHLRQIGYQPVLLCQSIPNSLIQRAISFDISFLQRNSLASSNNLIDEISGIAATAVIFDGYDFELSQVRELMGNRVVVVVDDNAESAQTVCHIIINQNIHASSIDYSKNPSSPELLIGPTWSLIRPEIVREKETNPNSRKGIFLSIGGTDPLNLMPSIKAALAANISEPIYATSGLLNSNSSSPQQVASEMRQSRVGVIACGTTVLEAVCLDLPFIGLITADNQELVGNSLVDNKVAQVFDCRTTVPLDAIIQSVLEIYKAPSIINRDIVNNLDGLGGHRVALRIDRKVKELYFA